MKPVFLMVKNPDMKPDFPEGHKSGFSEGRESGFSEGHNHAAIETARRMLQSNKFTIEEIAKFSGLSQQEVETISSDA